MKLNNRITASEFDFTQGNENPLKVLSISNTEALSIGKEDNINVVIFNNRKKEYYISATNVIHKRLKTWYSFLCLKNSACNIPYKLMSSLTKECISEISIAFTVDVPNTMKALTALEAMGWKNLSRSNKQSRMKTKKAKLYMVKDGLSGFTRYTLSAETKLSDVLTNVRNSALTLSNGKRLRGNENSAIICSELLRIANEVLYTKVKTTSIVCIKEDRLLGMSEKDLVSRVSGLNDSALQNWLDSMYVENLIRRKKEALS